jgi:hypothetical protein
MLAEFAHLIKTGTGLIWDPIEQRIGYVHALVVLPLPKLYRTHVINIATQKLISAYSKSPHFNVREPTSHIPDTSELMRDEIGLVRAIAVKVCVLLFHLCFPWHSDVGRSRNGLPLNARTCSRPSSFVTKQTPQKLPNKWLLI